MGHGMLTIENLVVGVVKNFRGSAYAACLVRSSRKEPPAHVWPQRAADKAATSSTWGASTQVTGGYACTRPPRILPSCWAKMKDLCKSTHAAAGRGQVHNLQCLHEIACQLTAVLHISASALRWLTKLRVDRSQCMTVIACLDVKVAVDPDMRAVQALQWRVHHCMFMRTHCCRAVLQNTADPVVGLQLLYSH
jgi:hypothetical protein